MLGDVLHRATYDLEYGSIRAFSLHIGIFMLRTAPYLWLYGAEKSFLHHIMPDVLSPIPHKG